MESVTNRTKCSQGKVGWVEQLLSTFIVSVLYVAKHDILGHPRSIGTSGTNYFVVSLQINSVFICQRSFWDTHLNIKRCLLMLKKPIVNIISIQQEICLNQVEFYHKVTRLFWSHTPNVWKTMWSLYWITSPKSWNPQRYIQNPNSNVCTCSIFFIKLTKGKRRK